MELENWKVAGVTELVMAHTLQQNVCRSPVAWVCLLETAQERGADLVLVQEPPEDHRYSHPEFDLLWTEGRVMTARRKNSDWTVSTEDGLARETRGDVQVLALGRRGYQGRVLRAVNAYFQVQDRNGVNSNNQRPAEKALWDDILTEDNCILAGDFNVHSRLWNPRCTTR